MKIIKKICELFSKKPKMTINILPKKIRSFLDSNNDLFISCPRPDLSKEDYYVFSIAFKGQHTPIISLKKAKKHHREFITHLYEFDGRPYRNQGEVINAMQNLKNKLLKK